MRIQDVKAKIGQAEALMEEAANGLEGILLDKRFIDIPEVNDIHTSLSRMDGQIEKGYDHLRDFARIARAARLKNPPDEKVEPEKD